MCRNVFYPHFPNDEVMKREEQLSIFTALVNLVNNQIWFSWCICIDARAPSDRVICLLPIMKLLKPESTTISVLFCGKKMKVTEMVCTEI